MLDAIDSSTRTERRDSDDDDAHERARIERDAVLAQMRALYTVGDRSSPQMSALREEARHLGMSNDAIDRALTDDREPARSVSSTPTGMSLLNAQALAVQARMLAPPSTSAPARGARLRARRSRGESVRGRANRSRSARKDADREPRGRSRARRAPASHARRRLRGERARCHEPAPRGADVGAAGSRRARPRRRDGRGEARGEGARAAHARGEGGIRRREVSCREPGARLARGRIVRDGGRGASSTRGVALG